MKKTTGSYSSRMKYNMEAVIADIKQAFAFGGLHEYLNTSPKPEQNIIVEYLKVIEQGDDLYHRCQDSQVKAYTFIQMITLADERNKRFYSQE